MLSRKPFDHIYIVAERVFLPAHCGFSWLVLRPRTTETQELAEPFNFPWVVTGARCCKVIRETLAARPTALRENRTPGVEQFWVQVNGQSHQVLDDCMTGWVDRWLERWANG